MTDTNFPPSASATLRLKIPLADETAPGFANYKKDAYYSQPLRLGPLEFRLQTSVIRPYLARCIYCDVVDSGFPWAGTVSGSFRIMDAEGKHVKYDGGPLKTLQMTDQSDPHSDCKHYVLENMLEHTDGGALYLELVLVLKVSIKSPAGGEPWMIPLSLLNTSSNNQVGINAELLASKEFSDMELESRDGERVPAHRVILAGRSAVFRTMFATEMREKAEGVVKIADMGTKALKLLLKFVYTGGFRKEMEDFAGHDAEVFLELVNAGRKYELPFLMTLSGVALLLRCTRENAWDLCLALETYGEGMFDILSQLKMYMEKRVGDLVCN